MIANPIFATFADYGFDRRRLIVIGVIIWSVATGLNALVTRFWEYLILRGGVGIGEAALVSIAPTLFCDFYPPNERNHIFAWYSMATPFGAGLGYIIGGLLSEHLGWRYAFLLCGVPGVILAFLVLTINDPGRGVFDIFEVLQSSGGLPPWKETLIFLFTSKRYVSLNLGYTLATFAIGALSDWAPAFLERNFHMKSTSSGLTVGLLTIISTPIGVFGGSYLADYFRGKIKEANFFICAIGTFGAFLLSFGALYTSHLGVSISFIFVAECFLYFFAAPWNTELSLAVPSSMRARGYGLAIFCSHAFGDAIASSIIGAISDYTHNLRLALFLVPTMIGLASIIWAISARMLDDDLSTDFFMDDKSLNDESSSLVHDS